ncbi:LLM class flavin-dependent oxidoreductase [Streptomyces mirabilis]|uniref:LLM class flavin-dependent oxidoreductase n=1 Tax=Streptomyces mirabilis TaxID=68239 RepID=A0ABU3V5Z9_9ACTN|nr:LLM class flavin-dependent oxidoreductase [Streptomyces mirabilis]MCX5357057.1 LLM class flavin-dependent oxidoreductase [Streptomyces mirabilis]MDU9001594.1 LLM class flavin-dependent oxidoreductase [Streptomyces mirabilis]
MKVHVVMRPEAEESGSTLERITKFACQAERLGFDGLWVNDTLGRGYASLDPIVLMTVAGTATSRIQIGTCVLQVPVRHPVELAHRIEGLHAMIGDRLQLGVGGGSTQADFDLVEADYPTRFKALLPALHTMRQAWRGEVLSGGQLTPWPGTEGGPAILLGAWRSRSRIVYAAEQCAGWIASAMYPKPEELETSIKLYRNAGGNRAVLANVITHLHGGPDDIPLGGGGSIMLTGGEAAARQKLEWIRDVGFDDVLCLARPNSLEVLARIRDAL